MFFCQSNRAKFLQAFCVVLYKPLTLVCLYYLISPPCKIPSVARHSGVIMLSRSDTPLPNISDYFNLCFLIFVIPYPADEITLLQLVHYLQAEFIVKSVTANSPVLRQQSSITHISTIMLHRLFQGLLLKTIIHMHQTHLLSLWPNSSFI